MTPYAAQKNELRAQKLNRERLFVVSDFLRGLEPDATALEKLLAQNTKAMALWHHLMKARGVEFSLQALSDCGFIFDVSAKDQLKACNVQGACAIVWPN